MKITKETLSKVYRAERCDVDTMILKGYTLVDELFVDSSGWGVESEPALTRSEFERTLEKLLDQHGVLYATITNAGMFQVYVGLFLRNGERKARRIGNNTLRIDDGGGKYRIRLHGTDIVTYDGTGYILNSGGWRTRTTKERINENIPNAYRLEQRDFEWYIRDTRNESVTPFTDNMKLA